MVPCRLFSGYFSLSVNLSIDNLARERVRREVGEEKERGVDGERDVRRKVGEEKKEV